MLQFLVVIHIFVFEVTLRDQWLKGGNINKNSSTPAAGDEEVS
jgi:hypothetical protein